MSSLPDYSGALLGAEEAASPFSIAGFTPTIGTPSSGAGLDVFNKVLAGIGTQENNPIYGANSYTANTLNTLIGQYGNLYDAIFHFGPGGSGCTQYVPGAGWQAVGWCYVQKVLGLAGVTPQEAQAYTGPGSVAGSAGAGIPGAGVSDASGAVSCTQACKTQFPSWFDPRFLGCNALCVVSPAKGQTTSQGCDPLDVVCHAQQALSTFWSNNAARVIVAIVAILAGLIALNKLFGGELITVAAPETKTLSLAKGFVRAKVPTGRAVS